MLPEALTKSYPENYPSDSTAILDAMSFSDGSEVKILGSMSIRSQQYAGDYDAFEVVKMKGSVPTVLKALAAKFKTIIKRLGGMKDVFIGDIKAGSVEEWRVIPKSAGLVEGKVTGYNRVASLKKLDELYSAKVITEGEKKSAEEMLKESLSPEEFLVARKKLKFHIIRWSVPEVLTGSKVLRDKSRFTLEDAFSSPSITKLDVIGLVQNNKYTEFSMIYEFYADGKVLNPDFEEVEKSLSEDIIAYTNENKPFKVLKRRFALAKFQNDESLMKKLTPILNSDLGRLYSIKSDVDTLIMLLEDHRGVPLSKLRYELDQFRGRMANIYTLPDFIKDEHELLGRINSAMKTPSRDQLLTHLKEIGDTIQKSLTDNTPKVGGRMPKQYLEGLTPSQKAKQTSLINKSKEIYETTGKVYDRPKVSDEPTQRSKHAIKFESKYGFPITDTIKLKETFPDTDTDRIISKGIGAYGSSGARANVSATQWSLARLASVLTGGPALRIDKDLVGPISMRKILSLRGKGITFSKSKAKVAPAPPPPPPPPPPPTPPPSPPPTPPPTPRRGIAFNPVVKEAYKVPTEEGSEIMSRSHWGNPLPLIVRERQQYMRDANRRLIFDERGQPIPLYEWERERTLTGITPSPTTSLLTEDRVSYPKKVSNEYVKTIYPSRRDPVYNFVSERAISRMSVADLNAKLEVLNRRMRELQGDKRLSSLENEPEFQFLLVQRDMVVNELENRQ